MVARSGRKPPKNSGTPWGLVCAFIVIVFVVVVLSSTCGITKLKAPDTTKPTAPVTNNR